MKRRSLPHALLTAACLFGLSETSHAQARPYARIGGWTVESITSDGQAQCRLTRIFAQETALRLVAGRNALAIDYMGPAALARGDRYDVAYWSGRRSPDKLRKAEARLIRDEEGTEWMRISETMGESDGAPVLPSPDSLTITPARGSGRWNYSLKGAKPALASLMDCLAARAGR